MGSSTWIIVENPLADYTMFPLPTANGDLFLGDSVHGRMTFQQWVVSLQEKFNILHKGYDNAASALDWMFKTYRDPKSVAVIGWSAGVYSPIAYLYTYRRSTGSKMPPLPTSPMVVAPIAWAKDLRRSSNPGGQRTALKRIEGFEGPGRGRPAHSRTCISDRPSFLLKSPFTSTTKGTMGFKPFSCGSLKEWMHLMWRLS